jgi:hypothetical protein
VIRASNKILLLIARSCAAAVAFFAAAFVFAHGSAAEAATPAGTAITNTATASYSDGTTTYNSQSNTVTVTVQNAPALTIAPPQSTPGANTVSPGAPGTDLYTLTNVGNSSGYFQLSGTLGTNDGVTAGQATFTSFTVTVPGQSAQTFTTVAALNTYLATGNTGGTPFTVPQASGTPTSANQITIAVNYSANTGASGTITTNLTATITQPAAGSAPAVTSGTSIGQYGDTITPDARMDAQKTATVGGTPTAPTVQYDVRFNNGGSRAMQAVNSASLPSGSGITGNGIIVTDKLPQYPTGTSLTLTGSPTFVKQPTGATFIYSTNGTTWTTTSTGATYIGVFIPASAITGTFGASNPGSSQGSVTAAQAQLDFTFTVNGSTANGAANTNAITNVVNSIYGDSTGYIDGPGLTPYTLKNDGTTPASSTAPAIANTNGTLPGSAQVTSAAAPLAGALLNGPNGFPGALGPDGSNNTDFTAISYTDGGNACCTAATNGGNVETVPASAVAITFTNSLQNTGNKYDTFTFSQATGTGLTALPAGWTVTYKSVGTPATANCAAVTAGTVITSLCVESGATLNYQTIYTPPASATTFNAYTPYGDAITATSGNDSTKTNATLDEFFVGGFVKLTKTAADAAGTPCSTATTFVISATANPGDCVQYTVTYLNVSPTNGSGANNVVLNASSIVITENGNATGTTNGTAYTNSWAANSNGLYAAPVDSTGGTLGGYSGGTAAGSTTFTDTIASLAAGASGNVTFKVQIK